MVFTGRGDKTSVAPLTFNPADGYHEYGCAEHGVWALRPRPNPDLQDTRSVYSYYDLDYQSFDNAITRTITMSGTDWLVMDLAREEGVTVQEPSLTRHDLFNAEECFLTGTGAELIPIVKIDGRVIGTGLPGPLTRRLVDKYRALTKSSGEPIYE